MMETAGIPALSQHWFLFCATTMPVVEPIPDEYLLEIEGLARLQYYVTRGPNLADIRDREDSKLPFYVVPVGEYRGIYNNQ